MGQVQTKLSSQLECVNSILHYPCMLWDRAFIPSYTAGKGVSNDAPINQENNIIGNQLINTFLTS